MKRAVIATRPKWNGRANGSRMSRVRARAHQGSRSTVTRGCYRRRRIGLEGDLAKLRMSSRNKLLCNLVNLYTCDKNKYFVTMRGSSRRETGGAGGEDGMPSTRVARIGPVSRTRSRSGGGRSSTVRYRAVFDSDQRGHAPSRPIRGRRHGRFLAPAMLASVGSPRGVQPKVPFAHPMTDGGRAIAVRPDAEILKA